jgi:hypothetical protein
MSARDVLCQAGWLLAAHLSFAGDGQGKGRLAEGGNHSPDTWANDPTEACSNYESSIAVRTTDPQHRRHPPLHARQRSRSQPHRRLHTWPRANHIKPGKYRPLRRSANLRRIFHFFTGHPIMDKSGVPHRRHGGRPRTTQPVRLSFRPCVAMVPGGTRSRSIAPLHRTSRR